jgi:pimeloyl-ACP methyl ester carboxylesterase
VAALARRVSHGRIRLITGRTTVHRRISAVALACAALLAGCSSDGGGGEGAATAADTSTSVPAALPAPAIDGLFVVDGEQRRLALKCWGEGSPTVVIDAGSTSPGIAEYQDQSIVRELAARTRVCTYDRAGLGASDPAPARKRGLDDVVDDLHALLGEADLDGPFVLVGSSGGGFDVYHHAGRYPDEVAALVLLDVPAGQANLPADAAPAWNSPENPEHIDYVAVERQMALDRLTIPAIPVTVITARSGQSADPAEQRVWLAGSSEPVQVVLAGGHGISVDNPSGVLAEIVDVLERVRSV